MKRNVRENKLTALKADFRIFSVGKNPFIEKAQRFIDIFGDKGKTCHCDIKTSLNHFHQSYRRILDFRRCPRRRKVLWWRQKRRQKVKTRKLN